jgi:cyclophilin family peptidyl-prolyl cis-trans isomerase
MKKTPLFLIIIMLSFSGCSSANKSMITENEAEKNMENDNTEEILNRMNEINRGAAPKVSIKQPGQESTDPESDKTQVQLDNLASEYSKALIKTNYGDITVEFYAEESPLTVNSFMNLAKKGFYDGTRFHRIIPDFMIQGGDPLSKDENAKGRWGTGGPEYRFQDEINSYKLVKGSLAMANSGPNTNGSQFFIVTAEETSWLDGKHTNFGKVIDGMDVVERIGAVETGDQDRPLKDVVVEKVKLLQ